MLETSPRSITVTPFVSVQPWAVLRQALAMAAKDVRAELRTKDTLVSTLVFALLVLITFNFALDLQQADAASSERAAGVLWVAIILAAMLGFNHVFAQEKEQGTLDGLLLCPVDRGAIYLGKFLGALAFTAVMEVAILPIFAIFTNLSVLNPGLLLAMVLGTVGFVAIGTLFAAVAMNTRMREVMLPVLLLPVASPIIIAATQATSAGLDGQPWGDLAAPLAVLAAFDVVYLTLCPLLFEYVAEEGGS